MESELVLTEEGKEYRLKFDISQPYIVINTIIAKCGESMLNNSDYLLKYHIEYANGDSRNSPLNINSLPKDKNEFEITGLTNAESCTIKFKTHNSIINKDVSIHIFYNNLKRLDIHKPFQEFDEHITYAGNNKIIFSAPFGHGKSTFLDLFFEERKNKEKYNVFKVFPLNYSVATNQDIFRYIKTDLLFQLLSHDLYFEKYTETYLNTIDTMIFEKVINVQNIVVTFAKLFSSIDKSNTSIGKVITILDKVLNKVKNKQQILSKDEKKTVLEYLEKVYEEEGSIYEDNIYTQLIKALLQQIKVDSPKKNVLIIEDLDRMDPEHVFRILNIISAHFDSYRLSKFEDSNKFGFDKIIVVGDLNNLEHLFAHKFGEKVDFGGYINKFFSVTPFLYDNKKAFKVSIEELFQSHNTPIEWKTPLFVLFDLLLKGNQLSLRDLNSLKHLRYVDAISDLKNYEDGNIESRTLARGLFIPSIKLISNIFTQNQILTKLEICKNKRIKLIKVMHYTINSYCSALLATIGSYKLSDKSYHYSLVGVNFAFQIKYGSEIKEVLTDKGNFSIKNKQIVEKIEFYDFTLNDFYDLLIENVKKYYQHKVK